MATKKFLLEFSDEKFGCEELGWMSRMEGEDPDEATGVVLSTNFGPGTTFASISTSQGGCQTLSLHLDH